MKDMDLWDVRNRPIKTFSGGMKKKVEIARAILHNPKVLFLDEPTKELDIPTKREMWDSLKKISGESTIFLCSHDIREVEVLCDDVCVIHKGKLTFSGSASQLKIQ